MHKQVAMSFEVLMYLNIYYFFMSGTCNAAIALTKYIAEVDSPRLDLDASTQAAILVSETVKLIAFHKLNDTRKVIATSLAIILTAFSLACLYYVFFIQRPILKLEIILDSMFGVLLSGELVSGLLSLLMYCRNDIIYSIRLRLQ